AETADDPGVGIQAVDPATKKPVSRLFCYRGDESELAVVTLFQGIVEVGGGMDFAVVLDLLVALGLDYRAVFQRELVGGVLEILLGHQYALEGFRVEAEGGAAFETLVVGIKVDALERSEERRVGRECRS